MSTKTDKVDHLLEKSEEVSDIPFEVVQPVQMQLGTPAAPPPFDPEVVTPTDPMIPTKGERVFYTTHAGNHRVALVLKVHPAGDLDLAIFLEVGDETGSDDELRLWDMGYVTRATHKPFSFRAQRGAASYT